MIKVLLNSKEINLDGALELNNKKIFYIDELDLDSKVQINITNGTKFISRIVQNDLSIEFTDKEGNVLQFILKNLAEILESNDGKEIVNITNIDSNEVLASISDIINAQTAAAAGANENANANAQNLKNPELTVNLETLVQQLLDNRNPDVYVNAELNLPNVELPATPGILRNATDDNNAPVLETLEALNLVEDGLYTNVNITNENGVLSFNILNPLVIAQYNFNPIVYTELLKTQLLQLINPVVAPFGSVTLTSANLIVDNLVNANNVTLDISVDYLGTAVPLVLSATQLAAINLAISSNLPTSNSIIGQATVTDLDGDTLTFTAPTTAGFVINPTTGVYTFDSSNEDYQSLAQGEILIITIPITVTDGNGGSDTQTLVINLVGTNDAPVIETITTQTMDEDNSITIPFTVTDVDTLDTLTTSVSATNGTASIVDGQIVFVPTLNFNGTATVTLTVNDGNTGVATQTFNVIVNAVNDAPVIEVIEPITTLEDGLYTNVNITNENGVLSFNILNPQVIAMYNLDSDTYLTSLKTQLLQLINPIIPVNLTIDNLVINETVSLGNVVLDVTVNYLGNDIPLVLNTTQLDLINSTLLDIIQLSNVLYGQINASDIDGIDTLTFSSSTVAGFSINPLTGIYTFDASVEEYQYLALNETLELTVVITVNDGNGGITTQNLVINLVGTNDAPTITSVLGTNVLEDLLTGSLTEIVEDLDLSDTYMFVAETVLATINSSAQNSGVNIVSDVNVTILSDGTYSVSGTAIENLALNEEVSITFSVKVTDGLTQSLSKEVTILIVGANDLPVIQDVVITDNILETNLLQSVYTGSLLVTDVDLNDTHTFQLVANTIADSSAKVTGLVINVLSDGTYTVSGNFDALALDETTTITFDYTATDSSTGISESKSVSLVVTGTNDAPVVTNQDLSDIENTLEITDLAFIENLVISSDTAAKDFSFSIANPYFASLYDTLNVEALIKTALSNSLNTTDIQIISTNIDGVINVSVSVPSYSEDVSLSTIINNETLNNLLNSNFSTAFNITLENSIYRGSVNVTDIDNVEDLKISFTGISAISLTTTNTYLASIIEQINIATPSLSYLQEIALDLLNGNVSLSTEPQTITVPTSALVLLQNSGLLTVSIDETTGEYTVFSPLFNTMKETDTISISFDYEVSDGIADAVEGTTTLEITGSNDAPVALDNLVSISIDGNQSFEGYLPGSYSINLLKNIYYAINLANGISGVINENDVLTAITTSYSIDELREVYTLNSITTLDVTYDNQDIKNILTILYNDINLFVTNQNINSLNIDDFKILLDNLIAKLYVEFGSIIGLTSTDNLTNDVVNTALQNVFIQLGLDIALLDKTSRDEIAIKFIYDIIDRLKMDGDLQDLPTLTYGISGNISVVVYDENGIDITNTLNLSTTNIIINIDGSYTILNPDFATLNSNYIIVVKFDYFVNDGTENSEIKTITVSNTSVTDYLYPSEINTLPSIEVVDIVEINEAVTTTFTFDASDIESTVTVTGISLFGTVIIDGNKVIYTPNQDFKGTDTITLIVTDTSGGTVEKTVTINETLPNLSINDTSATEPISYYTGQTNSNVLIPTSSDTPFTLSSPTGYELPDSITAVGGVLIDIISTTGNRLVMQLSASSLYQGFFDTEIGTIGIQDGITQEILDQLGEISQIGLRITILDGDTKEGNFDYNDDTLLLNNIEIANLSETSTVQTSNDGTQISSNVTLGFGNDTLDTGWVSITDQLLLTQIVESLYLTNELEIQLRDLDPEDNYFDFSQGIDAEFVDVSTGPTLTVTNSDAIFTITLDKAGYEDVVIVYETVSNSALTGGINVGENDYVTVSGSVTIPAGQTSVDIKIAINEDYILEGTETFYLNIISATNATILDNQGVATIEDSNHTPAVTEDSVIIGTVVEQGTDVVGIQTISGQIYLEQIDANDSLTWSFTSTSLTNYGSFEIDGNGKWTFTLDNTLSSVQNLVTTDTVVVEYIIKVEDSLGEFTEESVKITINGSDDSAPVIVAETLGEVYETVLNGEVETYIPTASSSTLEGIINALDTFTVSNIINSTDISTTITYPTSDEIKESILVSLGALSDDGSGNLSVGANVTNYISLVTTPGIVFQNANDLRSTDETTKKTAIINVLNAVNNDLKLNLDIDEIDDLAKLLVPISLGFNTLNIIFEILENDTNLDIEMVEIIKNNLVSDLDTAINNFIPTFDGSTIVADINALINELGLSSISNITDLNSLTLFTSTLNSALTTFDINNELNSQEISLLTDLNTLISDTLKFSDTEIDGFNYTLTSAQVDSIISSIQSKTALDLTSTLTNTEITSRILSELNLTDSLETTVNTIESELLASTQGITIDVNSVSNLSVIASNGTNEIDLSANSTLTLNSNGIYEVVTTFDSDTEGYDINISFNYDMLDSSLNKIETLTESIEVLTEDRTIPTDSLATILASVTDESNIINPIDELDIRAGDHILSNFTLEEFVALTDEDNTLSILGDNGDRITLDTTNIWSKQDTQENYLDVYVATHNNQTLKLLIEDTITVNEA